MQGDARVYHSSGARGLTVLEPWQSSHGERWVYATRDVVMAAAFLGTLGGDFTCAVGRDDETGVPFIRERFEGAFDLRYHQVSGSIYVLPGDTFVGGETGWEEEVVSREAVTPLEEIRVGDAKAYLLELAKEDKLIIKFYPEKIAHVPEDDEDLVYWAVIEHKKLGTAALTRLKEYHPHLLERVLQAIEEKKYRP